MRLATCVLILPFLALSAAARGEEPAAPVTFACDDGTSIHASWIPGEPATARLERNDEVRYVTQAVSASGARYEAADVELWNRGEEAAVEWRGSELACTVAGPVPPAARPLDADRLAEDLDRFVAQAMGWYSVPGAAVAVIHGDGRLVRAYGVLEAGSDRPVDVDTRFAIASLTKAMTADLAAIAVDRGALGWDEPIVRHVPRLSLADDLTTQRVTTRDLLSHRAGFQTFGGDTLGSLGFSSEEIVRRLRHFPLVTPLGTQAAYSNPGIFLAGLTASRALGEQDYETAAEKELFTPLGMESTDFFSGTITAGANIAKPHLRLGGSLEAYDQIDYSGGFAAAGAVVTSIADLANWLEMHVHDGVFQGRRILSEDSIEEIRTRVILEEPGFAEMAPISEASGFAYGLVWGIYPYQGFEVLEKGGARGGYRSVAVVVPEADLAVAVVANLGLTAFPEAVRAWLLEYTFGQPPAIDLQREIRQAQGEVDSFFAGVLDVPAAGDPIDPDLPLDRYTGSYENPLYGTLEVTTDADGLRWKIGDEPGYGGELRAAGYNTFLLHHPPGVLAFPDEATFLVGADRVPVELATSSYGTFRRIGEEP